MKKRKISIRKIKLRLSPETIKMLKAKRRYEKLTKNVRVGNYATS